MFLLAHNELHLSVQDQIIHGSPQLLKETEHIAVLLLQHQHLTPIHSVLKEVKSSKICPLTITIGVTISAFCFLLQTETS